MSRTPGAVGGPAPGLGEHGCTVLAEHGFTPEEIDALIADGALVDGGRKG